MSALTGTYSLTSRDTENWSYKHSEMPFEIFRYVLTCAHNVHIWKKYLSFFVVLGIMMQKSSLDKNIPVTLFF